MNISKMAFAACALALAGIAPAAFDNTTQNDFWDTTGYENPVTATGSGTATATAAVNSRISTSLASIPIETFDTTPLGCMIIIR